MIILDFLIYFFTHSHVALDTLTFTRSGSLNHLRRICVFRWFMKICIFFVCLLSGMAMIGPVDGRARLLTDEIAGVSWYAEFHWLSCLPLPSGTHSGLLSQVCTWIIRAWNGTPLGCQHRPRLDREPRAWCLVASPFAPSFVLQPCFNCVVFFFDDDLFFYLFRLVSGWGLYLLVFWTISRSRFWSNSATTDKNLTYAFSEL